jgi:hypothetical protein
MQAVAPFKTEKPQVAKIRVIAKDVDSGKSRCLTIYNITPDQFIEAIKGLGEAEGQRAR